MEEASGGQESHGQLFAVETKSTKQSLKAESPTGTLVIISTVAFPKLLIGFWMQVENTVQQGRVSVNVSVWKVQAMCQRGRVEIIFMCSANRDYLPLGKVKAYGNGKNKPKEPAGHQAEVWPILERSQCIRWDTAWKEAGFQTT